MLSYFPKTAAKIKGFTTILFVPRHDLHYLRLLHREAASCVDGFAHKAYVFAEVNFLENAADLAQTFTAEEFFRLEKADDYQNVLSRLREVPKYLAGIRGLLRQGINLNLTYARESLKGVGSTLSGVADVDTAEESPFFHVFKVN